MSSTEDGTLTKNGTITTSMINDFSQKFKSNPKSEIIKNAIIKNGIAGVTINRNSVIDMQYTFSEEIKTGKITSQGMSGRCWMFAGLNTFRQKISEKYKIKDFELSQVYPMFWDKLEKSNYFLENILETIEEKIDSRLVMWLLQNPIQDGGQWDMFSDLVEKYGVVPKYVMPETYHSGKTYLMNKIITLKLRNNAAILRDLYHKENKDIGYLKEKKKEMMTEIYQMLAYFLGEPPTKFDFEYRSTKDKKDDNPNNSEPGDNGSVKKNDETEFHADRNITPKEFFKKYVDVDLNDYVSVINAPTKDKPFNNTYTVKYLGSVKEGKGVLYLNVNIDDLKNSAIKQLKEGIPVWFGCDVRQMMDAETGIMDTDLFLIEDAIDTKFTLDKGDRLNYGESQLTHAMVFTGVNIVNDKPNRWKVENSWGDKRGNEGYFIMSDKWFEEYNYQIVVHKKYLTEEQKEALKKTPTVLDPWDPMGSLAQMK